MEYGKEYTQLTNLIPHKDQSVLKLIEEGLPLSAVKAIEKAWGVNETEVFELLGGNICKLQDQTNKQRLNEQLSDRAFQLARLMNEITDCFATNDAARNWLHTPSIVLGDVKPISLCNKATGMLMVRDAINRLKSGMTA